MRVMGIDPGIKGAIAVLEVISFHPQDLKVKLISVRDFPLVKEIKNKSKNTTRNRLDLKSLAFQMELDSLDVKFAMIEDVGKRQTEADPLSAFAFGYATGAVSGMLASNGLQIEKVKPEVWKSFFGLTSDKKLSIQWASRLVPESIEHLTLAKHDGRAEAILLAYYAARFLRRK